MDESTLAAAVQGKRLRAGLDVFAGQPSGSSGEIDSALFALDGVIGTHHIGGSTDQAQLVDRWLNLVLDVGTLAR